MVPKSIIYPNDIMVGNGTTKYYLMALKDTMGVLL